MQPRRQGAEALAARATVYGVGVLYFESAVLQGVHKIQFTPRDVKSAFRINHHFDAATVHQKIAIGRLILQIHFVLKPGTTAAHNRHPQDSFWTPLLAQQPAYFLRGARAHLDKTFVSHSNSGRGRCAA